MNGLVYFMKPIGMDGPIKIGFSTVVEDRLDRLGVWSPFPLEVITSVPGSIKDEQFLHACFFDLHTHHEWFLSAPRLRAAIAKIDEAGSLDPVRNELKPVTQRKHPLRKRRSPVMAKRSAYDQIIDAEQRRLRKREEGTPLPCMKLETYLKTEKPMSHGAFGELINRSQAAVTRYIRGDRFPDPETIRRIEDVTDGKVSVADWYAAEDAA